MNDALPPSLDFGPIIGMLEDLARFTQRLPSDPAHLALLADLEQVIERIKR